MIFNKSIPVKIGHITAQVYGGPFREYERGTRRLVGVKMASEIDVFCDISIPTEDFSVPSLCEMQTGLMDAINAILNGCDIYAGCMGGTGRTGLFMGCLVKCINDYNSLVGNEVSVPLNPIEFVRANYKPHAIETSEQEAYVLGFDSYNVVGYLKARIEDIAFKMVVVEEVEVRIVKVVYPSLGQYLLWLVFGEPKE